MNEPRGAHCVRGRIEDQQHEHESKANSTSPGTIRDPLPGFVAKGQIKRPGLRSPSKQQHVIVMSENIPAARCELLFGHSQPNSQSIYRDRSVRVLEKILPERP